MPSRASPHRLGASILRFHEPCPGDRAPRKAQTLSDNFRASGHCRWAELLLAGKSPQIARATDSRGLDEADDEKEVGAVEDLMREHGVIRRAILAYRTMGGKLQLRRTATLFPLPGGLSRGKTPRGAYLPCNQKDQRTRRCLRRCADGPASAEIDQRQFGKDGFEDAVAQMARVDDALGITHIPQFTPPPE